MQGRPGFSNTETGDLELLYPGHEQDVKWQEERLEI